MKRKLAFIFLLLILGAIGYLGFSIYEDLKERQAIEERIAVLPDFSVTGLDGQKVESSNVTGQSPFILTYFNTECQFCRSEIRSMKDHKLLQKNAVIYLVSDESPEILKQFNKEFELDSLQNIKVLQDSARHIKDLFGVRGVPSTFVYGRDAKLLNYYQGETRAEVLYDLIRQ